MSSRYVATVVGVVVLFASLALNMWVFVIISGVSIGRAATWLYRRFKYGNVGAIGEQGEGLRQGEELRPTRFAIAEDEADEAKSVDI